MEIPSGGPPENPDCVGAVLAQIEGVATTQLRMEAVLEEVRKDLAALSVHLNRSDGSEHSSFDPPLRPPQKISESDLVRTSLRPSTGEVDATGSRAASMGPGCGDAASQKLRAVTILQASEGAQWIAPQTSEKAKLSSTISGYSQVPPSLPEHWPRSLRAKEKLNRNRQIRLHRATSMTRRENTFTTTEVLMHTFSETVQQSTGVARHIMLDPNAAFHTAYSLLTLLILLHDILLIPYMLAWDVQMQGAFLQTAWTSCVFWSIDIIMSCFTGYQVHGQLELRPSFVLWRYARSWLVPDIIVVSSDWLSLLSISTDKSPSLRMLRFAKAGKLIRLIGLFRMMKACKIVEELIENSLSDTARMILRCFIIVCGMLWINHVFGCLWFAIGRAAPSDTGMRWTESSREWNGQYIATIDHGVLHQYITSIHWSVAQLTLGSMDVGAFNSVERIFNIMCLAMGLIFGSTLVSILSAGMVEHQMERNDQIQRLRRLRHFLRENHITRGVATLVLQQAKGRIHERRKLQEKDVTALQLVSKDLRMSVRYQTFKGPLSSHAFFHLWMDTDFLMIREFSMEAMDSTGVRAHDELFVPGDSDGLAYCLTDGRMFYLQEPMTAPVGTKKEVPVEVDQWMCEASLWSDWIHVGTARAMTQCQVVSISADGLATVLNKHPQVAQVVAEYSRVFHRRIITARPPQSRYPTDLQVPLTDFSEMIVAFGPDLQSTVGLTVLDNLSWHKMSTGAISKLREEIIQGKSTVVLNCQGHPERVVSVAALSMVCDQGDMFTELGHSKANSSTIKASCQLPAVKQMAGEEMEATFARLLARFGLTADVVHLLDVEQAVQWKDSKEYGIRTKYLRTIHHVELSGDLPLPEVVPAKESVSVRKRSRRGSFMNMGRTLSANTNSHPTHPTELIQAIMHRIEKDDKIIYHTWLDPAKFQHYSTPSGEKELEQQLELLSQLELVELAV